MRKLIHSILIIIVLVGLFSYAFQLHAQELGTCTVFITPGSLSTPTFLPTTKDDCSGVWSSTPFPNSTNSSGYNLLAPLPNPEGGELSNIDVSGDNALGQYLNIIIKLAIGLAAVLAVVMIVMGGIQYMTTELVSGKEDGKRRITNAVLGLLVALGAWLILFTINPDLLKTELKIDTTTIQFVEGPEITVGEGVICGQTTVVKGQTLTSCDESQLVTVMLFGYSVRVNKAIQGEIQGINGEWANSTNPKVKNYAVTSVGGYNPRSATNSNPPIASAHAFGLSVDINPSSNPYRDAPSPCVTDMPAAFVQLFTKRGFGWGGYWITKKDAMHFSKLINEAQYTAGTCDGLKS